MPEHDSSVDPRAATEIGAAATAATVASPAAGRSRRAATADGPIHGTGPGQGGADPVDPIARTATDAAAALAAADSGAGSALAGSRLAHFRIERLLGKGGMGEVYLATDLALDRPVALKFLPRTIAQDERLRERFYREARAQARINHPNVCHIYFIGEQDGQIFFAMEYIDGESLAERLDRDGALPVGDAVEMCRMAALGLREANRHGFTHRDVKPSNLMVDRNGAVKVVDFGIVKDTAGRDAVALTGEGGEALVGTPLYMSPEQAKGEPVDFRSDIYSLGATLHHLVAGSPPFAGDTQLAVISRHLSEPRPKLAARHSHRARRAGVALIDDLCDRMMAKKPAERFDSYDALVAAMEHASPQRSRPAGFWVRAFAQALDLFAVMIALVPVMIGVRLAAVAGGNGRTGEVHLNWLILAVAAAYAILAHARWGRTLGKLALEIKVVSERPGPGLGFRRAAVRFAAEWGPAYVMAGAGWLLASAGYSTGLAGAAIVLATLVAVAAPIVGGVVAAHMDPRKRTYWDRAAGTEVAYRDKAAAERLTR